MDEGDEGESPVQAEKPIAAAAAKPMNTGPDKWIVDTGSGLDLVGIQDVPPFETKNFLRDRNPVELHTANGITVVNQEVSMQIMSLMEDIHPLVLESTPAVLSVGKREGWTFIWNAWKNPLLISPSGKKIHLKVHGYVPYLVENKNYAMPADAHVPGI